MKTFEITHGYKEQDRPWQLIVKTDTGQDYCRCTYSARKTQDEVIAECKREIELCQDKDHIVGIRVERW